MSMAKKTEEAVQEGAGSDPELKSQLDDLEKLATDAAGDFTPSAADVAAPEAAPVPSMESAKMCGQLVKVVFGVMAVRRGDHWNLNDEEAGLMGGALGGVLDKYAPNMQTGPEAALVLAGLLIVGPRIAADVAAREKLEREQGGKDGDSSRPQPE